MAYAEIFRNVFVENVAHHFPPQCVKQNLLKDVVIYKKNSCAPLIIRTLPNFVQWVLHHRWKSLATKDFPTVVEDSVLQATCLAAVDSISVYLKTALPSCYLPLSIVGAAGCPVFWCIPSFSSLPPSLFRSSAQILVSSLWSLTSVCAVRNDAFHIFIFLCSVDSGFSSEGMSTELERVELWSRDIVWYNRRKGFKEGFDWRDYRDSRPMWDSRVLRIAVVGKSIHQKTTSKVS